MQQLNISNGLQSNWKSSMPNLDSIMSKVKSPNGMVKQEFSMQNLNGWKNQLGKSTSNPALC